MIKNKFPDAFNLRLEESRAGQWTVESLRKDVEKLIVARERSEKAYDEGVEDERFQYSGEGLYSNNSNVKCQFCENSHWSDECQMYKTLKDRKKKIRGKCFICFNSNHLFRECRSQKQCFYCKRKGNHHSALCPEKFQNT